jgi:membrane protein YdbS with pleckstrin-like domain
MTERIEDPKTIVEYLRQVPLFSDLDDDEGKLELYRVAKLVQQAEYRPGEWLFKQGDPARRLYIVIEGKVRLYRLDRQGNTVELRVMGPGDWVGETGLLVGDFHDATAEALTPVRVLYLEQEPFNQLMEERRRLRNRLRMSKEVARRRKLPTYDWLREDEMVIFAVNRHPIVWLRSALPSLMAFALLAALYLFLMQRYYSSMPAILRYGVDLVFFVLAIIFFGAMLWFYVNWKDDHFVLTTQRIVHSERVWPFKWAFQEGALRNIQDIHEVRMGIVSQVLDFGDLVLQTAGETVHIDLLQVPHPAELREMIFREIERSKARDVLRLREQIHAKLKERLSPQREIKPTPAATSPAPSHRRLRGMVASLRDYLIPSSWTVSPDGTTITWRRFWLVGLLHIFGLLLLMVAVFITWFELIAPKGEGLVYGLSTLLLGAIEVVLFFYALWHWEDWRNDYFQITPQRFIVVDRKPLYLREQRRETTLDRIQDINSNVPGLIARLLRCGTVSLETAGTQGRFQLDWLRYPEKIQAEISKRQEAYVRRQQEAEANRRQEEMLNWFATYEAIKREIQSGGSGQMPATEV